MKKTISFIKYLLAAAFLVMAAVAMSQTPTQSSNRPDARSASERSPYTASKIATITTEPAFVFSQLSPRYRVAVLPMIYIGDGDDDRVSEMRFQLQDIAINYLSHAAAELKFVDATEINAILFRNDIDDRNIRRFTAQELARILHVEYVIMGTVMQDKGTVITTVNTQSFRHENSRNYRYRRPSSRRYTHQSEITRQHIETQVTLSIYNETGDKIYTKSRHSILSDQNAYRNTIQYLLKRTPLYNR